ncbi:MAG: TIGR04283 family arsenosugar biosynthesis glycosyltransferase [Limisphaerales bacterium]
MISIIIPTLNESGPLPVTLEKVRANYSPHEIIIADGGSNDSTLAIASAARAKIVRASFPNRARQMNLGAREATGDIFLFLHADTQLRETSLAQIENALRDQRVVGGGFARRFDCDSFFLRATCAVATWRSKLFGWFLGDQGIFVRRKVFEELCGFKEMNLFEDVDFSRRLAGAGKTITPKPSIISSARRFEKRGPLFTTCRDLWLTGKYVSGLESYSAR